jgi:hypothetical protein
MTPLSTRTVRQRADPARADNLQQEMAAAHALVDVLTEIDPERNMVDIHEDRILAVPRDQAIEDAAGDAGRIRTSI